MSKQSFMNQEEFDGFLETATREELTAYQLDLQQQSTNIKNQLAKAKVEKKRTGEWADPDWHRRASHARRMIGLRMQQIAARFSMMRVERREQDPRKHDVFLAHFFRVTKSTVEEELFREIVAESNRLVGEDELLEVGKETEEMSAAK